MAGPGEAFDPAQAKALAAEKDIALIRLLVILFNVGTYYFLLPREACDYLAVFASLAGAAGDARRVDAAASSVDP